jgi:hypothetical protein
MPGNFATTWNPISNPLVFLQDFLNTPRICLQNSTSGKAKKVYKKCVLPSGQIIEKVQPHASRFDDKKIIFLGKFIKIHIKVPTKFVCK